MNDKIKVTQKEIDAVPKECATEWEQMSLALCYKIESMGASKELTDLSAMASALHHSIQVFNRYCDAQFEQLCTENPELESILRGKTSVQRDSRSAAARQRNC